MQSVDDLEQAVRVLHQAGLPTRTIGEACGISAPTVRTVIKELQSSGRIAA